MRTNVTVLMGLATLALVATPLVVGTGKALATPEAVSPAAVETVRAETAPAARPDPCARKVRVVYGGYGQAAPACAAR